MIKKIGTLTNLKVIPNFKYASAEIEPYNKDFLYFSARAVSAYETSGFNENGDAFLWDELLRSYKTFIGRNMFLDHDTNPLNTVGKVIDAYPVEEENGEKYIECLCKIDKVAFPNLARNIETGVLNSVSMGASVDKSICSVCGHYIESEISPKCEHMLSLKKDFVATWDFPKAAIVKGRPIKAFFINEGVRFTELSIVTNPADRSALVKKIVASRNIGNEVVYEKGANLAHSVWKIITPDKIVFSFPVYKIANLSKIKYYNTVNFGEYLKRTPISKVISDLKIGGNFMENIKSKIEKILEAEKEEERMGEKEDIKLLKEILKKLKNPEKNYIEIVEMLNKVIKNEEESAEMENKDIEALKEVLNELKEYFSKVTESEEEEEKEKDEEKDIKDIFKEKNKKEDKKKEEDKEDVLDEDSDEETNIPLSDFIKEKASSKAASTLSLLDLNERDLDVLTKVAKRSKKEDDVKDSASKESKKEDDIKDFLSKIPKKEDDINDLFTEPKKDEIQNEDFEIEKDEKEDTTKEKLFNLNYLKNLNILPKDDLNVVGEVGEVSAGPLGKVKKIVLKDSLGQVYDLYLKLMKKGEKIPVEIKEDIVLEDKRNILAKFGDVSKLSDEEIASMFDSYIGFNNGNVESFQNLISIIAKMKEEMIKMKVESDLKDKLFKCSYLLEKKMELGEISPDPEKINQLVIKGESFMKARDIVIDEMKRNELKKLMSLPSKDIEAMYSQYQKKAKVNTSLDIGGLVANSYQDLEVDPDEEFLKKLPWQ